ncbi:insulinase family protein, partial [Erwinia amylovora]|nr:insulinase family protein [Erwinia amylovora]
HPNPPVISSYEFSVYNISLANIRPEVLLEALSWLGASSGLMTINLQVVYYAIQADLLVAWWPFYTQDVICR